MKNILDYEFLSVEEEKELNSTLYLTDREKWREQIILHNARPAVSFAKRYKTRTEDEDDMVQIAMLGLVNATYSFDPTKGYRFITYAARCILSQIREYVPISDKSGPKMNAMTVPIIDLPLKNEEGGEKKYGDYIGAITKIDWQRDHVSDINESTISEKEYIETVEYLAAEIRNYDADLMRHATYDLNKNGFTVASVEKFSREEIANLFLDFFYRFSSYEDLCKKWNRSKEFLCNMKKVFRFYFNRIMWSDNKLKSKEWSLWKEIYSFGANIEESIAFINETTKKQPLAKAKSSKKGHLDDSSRDGVAVRRPQDGDVASRIFIGTCYDKIAYGFRELKVINEKKYCIGTGFYTMTWRSGKDVVKTTISDKASPVLCPASAEMTYEDVEKEETDRVDGIIERENVSLLAEEEELEEYFT